MRMKRAALVGLCIVALGAACTDQTDNGGNGRPDPDDGAAGPRVTALPSMCEGVGPVPEGGEITFAKGSLLFGVPPNGGEARCITAVAGTNPVYWGPLGDYVVDVGFSSSVVITEAAREVISGPDKSPRFNGLSRPSGANGLFTAVDGSSLAKVPVDGGKIEDISFLRRHDEATYHPAGTQIAVIGQTQGGNVYGVWLIDNEAATSHQIVASRDEDEFYGVSFSSDGTTLYYVDDQHSSFELRSVDLSTIEPTDPLPKSTLLLKERLPMTVTASPFTEDLVVSRLGTCEDGFKTLVGDGSDMTEVAKGLGETQPLGWLPDDRLVVGATEDLCDPARILDLYVVDGSDTELLVEGVTQAAVRVPLPEGPAPVSGPVGSSPD